MILDVTQNKDSVDISYVDDTGKIFIETVKMDGSEFTSESGETYKREYHNFVECDEFDPERKKNLLSFNGSPIKLQQDKYFQHHNVNYFLNYEIPTFLKDVDSKINKLSIPVLYSVDIETDITDEHGYSSETEALNPIRSISITDEKMNTILFIVKNEKHPSFDSIDRGYIDNIMAQTLGDHYSAHEYNYDIKVFDTEIEMLTYFVQCIRNYFHTIIGWNFYGYDIQYISNRCTLLGISWKHSSPTGKLVKKRIAVNDATHINIEIPAHRVIIDYMLLFKESLIYNNLGRYNLDSIADMILGLKKVTYQGNLRTLYESDYLRFVAYSLIDTIIVMLIHSKTNLTGIEFFQSYYTGVPFVRLSQNSISEALVYKELIKDNRFLLMSECSQLEARKYAGAYVKAPTTKIVGSVSGLDFGSLYPNSMITCGLSPEAKIDVLSCGDDGFPNNPVDMAKWSKYKELGYCLSPMGRVYDVSKDFLFTRIEKNLLAERKLYRGHADDIYLNILSEIEKEISRRNLQ